MHGATMKIVSRRCNVKAAQFCPRQFLQFQIQVPLTWGVTAGVWRHEMPQSARISGRGDQFAGC